MSIAEKLVTVAENVPKVHAAGKQDVLAALTNNYKRTNYENMFREGNLSGLDFAKTVYPTALYNAFTSYKGESIPSNMDCSKMTVTSNGVQWAFRWAELLKVFPDIKIPAMTAYAGTWQGCKALETIEMVRCTESTTFSSSFADCIALKNITFGGYIGQNISFDNCKVLSGASIEGIINNLSPEVRDKTLTLSSQAVTSAFGSTTSAEWASIVSRKPYWIISLVKDVTT